MLEQALIALAAAGGAAVVQAAGTDLWEGLRQRVGRWFGRGDAERERAALNNLDRTERELAQAGPASVEGVRRDQTVMWRTRIEGLLENLPASEQAVARAELEDLLNDPASPGGATAGQGGLAVGGNLRDIRADHGSIAAGTISGGARITSPPKPDPSQG
ncbi:hypothetical protein OG389_03355 [Streptomyces sp. NBC_00435]|uniref:hypothetical protein n=1 Tax=Streptomyces sp. NBC_00435 TaxID=2903649 RepID=UPI002E1A1768